MLAGLPEDPLSFTRVNIHCICHSVDRKPEIQSWSIFRTWIGKNWTGTWCWADQAQASRWPLSVSSSPRSSFLQNSDFSTAPPSERVMFIACFKDKGNHKLCLMLMRNGCLASYDVGDISHCTDRDSPELRVFSSLFSAAWKWKFIFLKESHKSTLL